MSAILEKSKHMWQWYKEGIQSRRPTSLGSNLKFELPNDINSRVIMIIWSSLRWAIMQDEFWYQADLFSLIWLKHFLVKVLYKVASLLETSHNNCTYICEYLHGYINFIWPHLQGRGGGIYRGNGDDLDLKQGDSFLHYNKSNTIPHTQNEGAARSGGSRFFVEEGVGGGGAQTYPPPHHHHHLPIKTRGYLSMFRNNKKNLKRFSTQRDDPSSHVLVHVGRYSLQVSDITRKTSLWVTGAPQGGMVPPVGLLQGILLW